MAEEAVHSIKLTIGSILKDSTRLPEARSNEPIAPEQYLIHARKR